MIKMVKFDDAYVPEEWCTMTNPRTSGDKSEPDDVLMRCEGAYGCTGACSGCIIQKLMDEYAIYTRQADGTKKDQVSGLTDQEIRFVKILYRELIEGDEEPCAVREKLPDYLKRQMQSVMGSESLERHLQSAGRQRSNDRRVGILQQTRKP